MTDETNWAVPQNRVGALQDHSARIRNDGSGQGVLYYPGSGADIMHALFAARHTTRYFIFADPADLAQALPNAIRQNHSALNGHEAGRILAELNVRSQPAGAWMFSVGQQTRFLFHFRTGHEAFIAANRGFRCDTVFDKDFWETANNVGLDTILAILRVSGHYSTNASIGQLRTALDLVGLRYTGQHDLNGPQYLYQRRAATAVTWAILAAALAASERVIHDLMDTDGSALEALDPGTPQEIAGELLANRAALLAPFAALAVPGPRQNALLKEIAHKAVGEVWPFSGGVALAFP